MDSPLVECIPNFSEGRRLDVVEQIVATIRLTSGVFLLDYSSDHDHNRSVVTFVGPPQAVEDAAFAAIAKAAELIDLEKHRGEHPRIGATDVVPFVPIAGVTMKECVEIAQRLGKRVGEELGIPVYLYEQAATRPDRENLANVRKGEYEGLKDEIKTNPDRVPDFGPNALSPAGATIIGARSPLIAYNVYLDTDDVGVADKIARSIRYSSGGLRFVKGLGMLVDGKAQVSMNLTDYRNTPVFRVVEMIRREAARYGANITHSELIGLIPQKALIDAAEWYLQLDDFTEEQVLESRIRSVQAEGKGKLGLDTEFLDRLATGTSTPGGGSAAAYCGAMAAGLVTMVAHLTLGKKKYQNVEKRMGEIVRQAEEMRAQLTASVEKDATAYDSVMEALLLPKSTKKEVEFRKDAIQNATLGATQAPLEVATMAVKVLQLALEVAEKGNVNAITDAGTGAALALASLRGAVMNVRINLTSLEDESKAKKFSSEIESLEKEAINLQTIFQTVMEERGGMPFK
jgi:glutamate formiminotransferase/formiminotetrahydrofolate cyclodeaminase